MGSELCIRDRLIKAVKHVAQQNRKVYMLYELEPSREITGGAWYTEHEYDAEFISVLREQCVKFIMSRGKVTLDEVCDFVKQTKLSHVELGQEEVLQIVNTLVYDGQVAAHEEVVPDQDAEEDGGELHHRPDEDDEEDSSDDEDDEDSSDEDDEKDDGEKVKDDFEAAAKTPAPKPSSVATQQKVQTENVAVGSSGQQRASSKETPYT